MQRPERDHVVFEPRRLRALAKGSGEAGLRQGLAALENLQASFHGWILEETDKLGRGAADFTADPSDEQAYEQLKVLAREYRANALQFGFPVASRIADNLFRMLEEASAATAPRDIIRHHTDAIAAIVRSGPDEGQNPTALSLAEALERLTA